MEFQLRFFSCLFLFLAIHSFECPNGSQQVPQENVCIYLIEENRFYDNVIHRCAALGAIPAKIRNIYENAFLFAMTPEFNGLSPYIGLERQEDDSWAYSDGSPVTYLNWAIGEPNLANNVNLCAVMDPQTGKWISSECSVARPFFCSLDGKNNNNFTTPATNSSTTTSMATSSTDSSQKCRDGWIYNENTDYCYYLQNFTCPDAVHWQLYDWTTAETNCQQIGAHLVSIHSKEEDDFINDLISSNVVNLSIAAPWNCSCCYQPAWIGYYGNGKIGSGSWTDGSKVDYVGSDFWPISVSYPWMMTNDQSCYLKKWEPEPISNLVARFVCKATKGQTFTTPTTASTSTPASTTWDRRCQNDWIYNKNTGYCYYLQNFTNIDAFHWQLYDWTTAETNCQQMGAHLASIHNYAEEDFVYDMIHSNVANVTILGTKNNSCIYQWTWIGYFGDRSIGNGNWSDGSEVDYVGFGSSGTSGAYWAMSNDQSCGYKMWTWGSDFRGVQQHLARFLCKMPSTIVNEKMLSPIRSSRLQDDMNGPNKKGTGNNHFSVKLRIHV